MRLFSRRKKEAIVIDERPEKQKRNDTQVAARHQKRVDNLRAELEVLESDLFTLEGDSDIVKSTKDKDSDSIIRRMVLIKYEVGIREDLIKWLS